MKGYFYGARELLPRLTIACLFKSINPTIIRTRPIPLHDGMVLDSSAEMTRPAAANALPQQSKAAESDESHPTHPETRIWQSPFMTPETRARIFRWQSRQQALGSPINNKRTTTCLTASATSPLPFPPPDRDVFSFSAVEHPLKEDVVAPATRVEW